MCEKMMLHGDVPIELEPLEYKDCEANNPLYPPVLTCHRCDRDMIRLPVLKFTGPRYECPTCLRLIKMNIYGKIEVLRAGRRDAR